MKKLFILGAALFMFGCDNTAQEAETDTEVETEEVHADEPVDIGAGENISPQLDIEEDASDRELEFEDTIRNARDANR